MGRRAGNDRPAIGILWDDINDVAARLSVSRETVRKQLKAVFAKTGVRRQSDLIALLANLLPNASQPGGWTRVEAPGSACMAGADAEGRLAHALERASRSDGHILVGASRRPDRRELPTCFRSRNAVSHRPQARCKTC